MNLRTDTESTFFVNELVSGDIVAFQVGRSSLLGGLPCNLGKGPNSCQLSYLQSAQPRNRRVALEQRDLPARKSDVPRPSIAFMFATRNPLSCRRALLTRTGRGTGLVISTAATVFGSVFTLMQPVEEKRARSRPL
ncbi:hypothetical protein CTheo_8421 [Ceratobasidium theobromae]|uniref:Transmembrane protein n=1 Tax=Ceratobasidium theobromae TaxID=1582974 RepID=A0A5N5Q9M8_9AGAM|nr:hypothetical protein CTheo_8421 [Ceratobasidium theobromae]